MLTKSITPYQGSLVFFYDRRYSVLTMECLEIVKYISENQKDLPR